MNTAHMSDPSCICCDIASVHNQSLYPIAVTRLQEEHQYVKGWRDVSSCTTWALPSLEGSTNLLFHLFQISLLSVSVKIRCHEIRPRLSYKHKLCLTVISAFFWCAARTISQMFSTDKKELPRILLSGTVGLPRAAQTMCAHSRAQWDPSK